MIFLSVSIENRANVTPFYCVGIKIVYLLVLGMNVWSFVGFTDFEMPTGSVAFLCKTSEQGF